MTRTMRGQAAVLPGEPLSPVAELLRSLPALPTQLAEQCALTLMPGER